LHRDRGTLPVVQSFAKSLEVIEGHSKWHCCIRRV